MINYGDEKMTIRILIVDDREVVRNELRNLLGLYDTLSVVGEAADGWQALNQAKRLSPDVVLMDLEMPQMDGFEATRRIKAQQLARSVIVFSVYADSADRQKAQDAGADAFVIKGSDMTLLVDLCEKLAGQTDGNSEDGIDW